MIRKALIVVAVLALVLALVVVVQTVGGINHTLDLRALHPES